MDVTDVLRDRMDAPTGFKAMVAVSVAAHALFAAGVVFAPQGWLARDADAPKPIMTISIGGAGEGPLNGGMTASGGRPVQEVRPPDEPAKREAVRPPAAKAPEMTLPLPNAKTTKASAAPAVTQAPKDARGKTPTKGTEKVAGATVAETPNRGMGFGMSTGGGPGSGSSLDVADFCCPEYIALMQQRLRTAWQQNQGTRGDVIVRFTIQRDGKLTNYEVERSSGNSTLDLAALRAVVATGSLTPLPGQFPNPTLTVHLNFQYQ